MVVRMMGSSHQAARTAPRRQGRSCTAASCHCTCLLSARAHLFTRTSPSGAHVNLPPLLLGTTGGMYVNPAYGHHHRHGAGESTTDDDYGEANSNVQRAAWSDSAAKYTGNPAGWAIAQPQQSSRRAWLRDAGIVMALLMAGLALGLALGKASPAGCSCATEIEAVSALHASEVRSLNATLAVMQAEMNRLGRAVEVGQATMASELDTVEGKATELCDSLLESDALFASIEVSQEIATSGAVDWEAFEIDNVTYLAVANYADDDDGLNTMSRIYRHSNVSNQFELAQEIATSGGRRLKTFVMDGVTHLAVANYIDDSGYNIMSTIYRHSNVSGRFELMQEVATSGAHDWESFLIKGTTFLAVANYCNGSSYNIIGSTPNRITEK